MEANHRKGRGLDQQCCTARKGPGARGDTEEVNLPGMRCQERRVKVQIKAKFQHLESQMHDLHESEFIEMLELHLRGQVA